MPRLRLSLGALVAAVATLAAMVCLPAPAFALPSGNNITITSAGPDSTGNPYDLTVVASDTNGASGLQLTTMAAHVFNASDQEVPGSPYSMSYASGAPSAQTWVATPPIPQADLPPGTYTVKVDASDGVETDLGLPAPGPFSFSYMTKLTAMANPPTVTQGSENVTLTGTVTGVAPGGTPVGLANVPVNLAGAPSNPVATTASDGSFTCPASACQTKGITQTTTYAFSVAADPGGTYSAATTNVTVNAQQATTAISVTPNPTSVSLGSPGVTFTGAVTITPQGSTTATGIGSAVPVDVSINGVSTGQVLTSDANGDFSYPAAAISATTTYIFSVAATPLYTGVSSSVIIHANQAQTAIAVTPSPAFVTLGSQDVTFSGTVTALPPGATTAVPVPGADVFVNGGSTKVATTDASGKFTYSASNISQTTSYTFSVNQANLYSAATDQVTIPLDPGHTEMIATANPPDVHLGSSTVTFSGTVTVTPAGGTTAGGIGSGVPVYLSVNGGPATQVTTTDDANGDFTDKITGITTAADYNFSVNAAPFWSAATADVPIGLQQLAANLVVTPSRVSVTEGSQSVSFSGVLNGTAPGSTVVVDISNAPVYLDGGTTPIATTDQNGAFSYVIGGIGKASSFNFSVSGTPTTYSNATDYVPIGVTQAQTRITGITTLPVHLKYGQKATLAGTVQYRNGTTWTALPGAAVLLFEGKTSLGGVRTGKGGSFTASLPTTHGPAWRATLSSAILWQQASAIGNLSISVPMKVKYFAASLSVLGSIKAAGCLQVTVPVRYGPESKIEIQYAAGSRGPWKELGKLQLHNVAGAPALCRDANESYFSGSIRAKLANAYYRADFPGSYSFQPTVSSVIHAWRYQTKITDYKVNPRAISTGDKLRISGRLWVRGRIWKPYGKRKVDIIYNEKGTSYWGQLPAVKTSYGGYFSQTGVGTPGKFVAIFYAFYPGSKTDLAVMSIGVPVAINEGSTTSAAPPPTATTGGLPLISLPTYRGLGMLAQDAVDIATREIRALAFWPR